jgi:DNA-binding transcriptional LysR family regulator
VSKLNIDELDFRKLRAFYHVARQGSLRLAALRLNQTISATSTRIKRLESELGVDLFERLPNRLVLTTAGARFLAELDPLFAAVDRAMAVLSEEPKDGGRVSISTGFDHSWYFAPRISAYSKKHVKATFSLHAMRASDALRALLKGDLDVSFGIFPKIPKSLVQRTIIETPFSIMCRYGDPVVRQNSINLGELNKETLIVLPRHSDTRKIIEKSMARLAIKPKSVFEVASCETASTFVEAGIGVAIVHSICACHVRPRGVEIRELGPQFGKIPFLAVFRRAALESPLVAGLLDYLSRG